MHFILIYIEFGYSSNFFYIMKHKEQSIINKVFCSAEMNSAICFVLLYSVWDQNSRQGQKENNKCR